ncbi:hypothetical protein ABZ424_02140 [Streptomyces sp. NPDC005790]|uniref:hypothetical protein n=1 Tax=Streptomyces sp. NPDC005790 TaxID=3154777 RepID=UPI0033DE15D4
MEKLKEIKRDAGAFLVKVNADDKWREDGDLIEENNDRRDEIRETLAAFQAAERDCHNKIVALVCGVPLKAHDGSESKHQYGYDAETLEHVKGLPWGDPLVESTPGWQVWEHAWDFTKGFFVDGVWGTVKGLGTLVGFDGWDAAGQAWKGLAQLATGVAISLSPVAAVQFWTAKDEDLPTWLRESRTAVKETGKALIAYDQWGENPARAAGAVTFNVVTTVFTGGTGGAVAGGGKAALAAKALSAAGKVGRFVDPMTYIFKGTGFGLTKIGDAMAGLKGLGTIEIPPLPDNVFTLPEGAVRLADGTVDLPAGATLPDGAVRLADGTVRLPEGVIALPEGTVKNPFDEGAAYADLNGNLYDESGNLVQRAEDARTEPAKTDLDANTPDHTRVETPVRQPVLVGAGARGGSGIGDGIRLGNDLGGVDRVGDDLLGGRPDDFAHGPAASHGPSTGGHGDSPHEGSNSDGLAGSDRTPKGGSDHVPGGSGSDGPPPPDADGLGRPGAAQPDSPRGNLPDGSWTGENGLRLDREANAAADDFMRRSAEAEPRITQSMQSIAGKVDSGRLIGLEYRLKGDESLKRKFATDMLEDSAVAYGRMLDDIKDSIRYTMEVPGKNYTHGVQQVINDLQAKGFENVTFKNTWDSVGYKGINSTWRDPLSGQIFELQFHTADSFVAKMDGHALYEKERLPGNTSDELAAIRAEQSELFGKVPIPRDAGAIRLGAHSADDVASAFGRHVDATPNEVPLVADDVGHLGDDAAEEVGRATDDAADGAGKTQNGYTNGSDGGWGGAGWVEQPSDYAAGIYDSLRATPNHIDIPAMSRNTGINESVLRQVKSHMIRSQYDVVVRPGEWVRGRFTPRDDIADLWDGARKGTLDKAQIKEFRNLMTHEYVESRLMKAGLPYLHDQAGLWRKEADGTYADGGRYSPKSLSAAGAHDLAPNPVRGGFGTAWQKLGLRHPKTQLAEDLSNIDDFVKDVFHELRAKGLNLK